MSVISALARTAVTPLAGTERLVRYKVFAPSEYAMRGPKVPSPSVSPLVSCLLVTKGDRAVIRHAIECYKRQSYANCELVVVTHPDGLAAVEDFVRASRADDVSVHSVGREMTLGDCRNVAIARARGDIVMQWDDDDLYDPDRIAVAVALLTQSTAVAVMQSQVLVWWPKRRLAAISENRLWEGSIAVWREHAPSYPSLVRGEDTLGVESLARTRTVATYDLPLLYIYTVHARNTWHVKHFETIVQRAERVFQGADYVELMRLLSARTPARSYERDSV